jgi:hypothetical protein
MTGRQTNSLRYSRGFEEVLNLTDIPKESTTANDADLAPPLSDSTSRWAFINGWKVEPQSNDRAPEFGVVAPSAASPSARRSSTRRKHQAMFKVWSKDRHD